MKNVGFTFDVKISREFGKNVFVEGVLVKGLILVVAPSYDP